MYASEKRKLKEKTHYTFDTLILEKEGKSRKERMNTDGRKRTQGE